MRTEAFQKLVGCSISGMFDLRLLLTDCTTESHVDAIMHQINLAYERYRQETRIPAFTPHFKFTPSAESPSRLNVEIYQPTRRTFPAVVGHVPLKTKIIGKETILTIYQGRKKAKHYNTGLTLSALREVLPEFRNPLPECSQQGLDYFLRQFEGKPLITFDLDYTLEAVTLVVYHDCVRCHTATYFY